MNRRHYWWNKGILVIISVAASLSSSTALTYEHSQVLCCGAWKDRKLGGHFAMSHRCADGFGTKSLATGGGNQADLVEASWRSWWDGLFDNTNPAAWVDHASTCVSSA